MLLFLLGSLNVWGADAVLNSVSTKEVTAQGNAGQNTSVSKEFSGVTCTVTKKSNNNNQPGFYTSSGIVRYYSGDEMTLSVASGNNITAITFVMNSGTVGTASVGTLSQNSLSWSGSAQSVTFTGGATVKITSISVTYSSSSSNPTVSTNPTSLTFDAVEEGGSAPSSKTFTISGSNLTGALTVESSNTTLYACAVTAGSLTPTSKSVSATITVTPQAAITESAGTKEANITISGGGLTENVNVALSTTVTAPAHVYTYNKAFSSTTISDWSSWGGYAAHTVNFDLYNGHTGNDCHVNFASASKQSGTITDKPVAKDGAVNLILDDPNKYISAVKFVGEQWGTKAQTMVLKYSTDGGDSWTAFDPAKEATNFVIEELNLPAKVNAVQVAGKNSSNQIGYASVHFDLVDKVTYSIGKDETGCTLSVTDGTSAITTAEAGDEVYVSIASTETGYENAGFVVKDAENNTIPVTAGKFTMPAMNVTITATATKKQYTVTLSATNGKIQVGGVDKESITVAHGETAELTADPNTDFVFNGWTSSDGTKVALSGANDNPVTITVTGAATVTASFISSALDDPELSWSSNTATIVKGQTPYSLPSLTNEHGLTIAYESSNTDVAEIATNGAVTIKGVGETTITASNEEEGGYAESSKSYTLTVKGRVTWHIIKESTEETSYADYAAGTVPTKPVGVTPCDASISLVGWTTGTYFKSDDAPTPLYTEDVPVVTDNADYYAVWGVSSADSEASLSEGVNTGGIIDGNGWTNSGAGSYANHGLKFDTQGDNITSPNISSENLKSVVVKFRAGYNSQQNSGSVFTIYAYDSGDNVLDSKTCEPETDFDDQNDYSYTLSGSATIAYIKIALTTKVANVGMEYAELFKIIPGSTTGYTTNCVGPVVVTDPEFDVATGTYYEVKTVRISNHDDDYLYFYTLDGTDPAADSNLDPTGTSVAYNHTTGIAINESCTLKAIAYDIDGNHSEVVSAAYVINLPVSTIQALQSHANGDIDFKFENILVTAVTSEKQAFISDGTYGAIIYINAGHGLAEGDLINSKSGTAYATTLTKYHGAAELTVFDAESTDLTITSDQTVPVQNKAITDLSVANIGMIVDLGNLTYDAANDKFTDAGSNEIAYYDAYKLNLTLEDGAVYAVKGLVNRNYETLQISPRSTADMVKQTSKEAPSAEWFVDNTPEAESISGTYRIEENADFNPYFKTNSDGEKLFASSNTDVATINPTTGALTIAGVGTTTISCALSESENYYARPAVSFTLLVRPEGSGEATWVAKDWAASKGIESNTAFSGEYETIAIDANVSMTWAKAESSNVPAYNNNNKEARLYNKATLTFNASNSKQITGIVFHFTSGNEGNLVPSDGDYTNSSWEGFTNSVTFTNNGSAAYIKSIDIEYAQGTTTTLVIEDMVILNDADATTIVYSTNKPGAVVVYSDYDDEVITIADGKVTPVAIGNTTVKATIAAEAPYSSVSITFNVRVKSSTETVETVVILSQFEDKLFAMKHDFTAVEVERAADGSFVDLSVTEDEIKWTKTTDGSTAMFQQYGTNKYMAVGSSNALVLSDDATVWTLSDEGYYYNVSGRTFLYQGNGAKYKNYSAGNAGKAADGGYSQLASFVADPQFVTRDVLRDGLFDGKWGTYCPSKDVKYPAGASFYTLTYKEEVAGQPYKVFFDEVEPGAALVGGKPYLFIAEGEAIKGIKVGEDAVLHNYNGFTGVLSNFTLEVTAAESEAYQYYIVYGNEIRLCGAGQFNVPAERAYLDMSQMSSTPVAQAPGRRRISLVNHAAETATGIENAETNEAPRKVLINGELYIIRGEKMYDAKGQLVK